jgi:hypothetical protein
MTGETGDRRIRKAGNESVSIHRHALRAKRALDWERDPALPVGREGSFQDPSDD